MDGIITGSHLTKVHKWGNYVSLQMMSSKVKDFQNRMIAACDSYNNDGRSLLTEIESLMPELEDDDLLGLIDAVKDLALNGKGDPAMVNWMAGMMLDDFAERLKPYQHHFVDDFMSVSKRQMTLTNVRLPTLYFGLSNYDLSKHIDLVTEEVTSDRFEPAFNIIKAFATMDYTKIPKQKLMQVLHIFRKYKREGGKHCAPLKRLREVTWDIDDVIWRLRYAVLHRK